MSKKPESYQLEPERLELLARAFDGLPTEYESLSSALSALRVAFHANVARTLEPAISRRASSLPSETFSDRKRAARWVDTVTRELGVTTADSKTGRPGLLVAENAAWAGAKDLSFYSMLVRPPRAPRGIGRVEIGPRLRDLHLIPSPANIDDMFDEFRTQPRSRRER
jgi:hypothetical protein